MTPMSDCAIVTRDSPDSSTGLRHSIIAEGVELHASAVVPFAFTACRRFTEQLHSSRGYSYFRINRTVNALFVICSPLRVR